MTGAQVLCFALMGPAQKTEVGIGPGQRPKQDGKDGPGFAVVRLPGTDGALNTADDDLTVRPAKPPYLSDTFRYGDPIDPANPGQVSRDDVNVLRFTLLDRNNKPILYFPVSGTRNVKVAGVPAPYVDASLVSGTPSETSKYDADDNLLWFGDDPTAYASTQISGADATQALKRIRALLGDTMGAGDMPGAATTTPDGVIQQYETAIDQPYLLWGAGPDERFGPGTDLSVGNTLTQTDRGLFDKCDDVTNFRQ
jgi:hypothetical protein